MTNVLAFPAKVDDPLDDVIMCTLTITGRGDIEFVINVDSLETVEQHNWLIAKMVDATSRLVDRKKELSP